MRSIIMIIFRKSDNDIILHDPLTHTKRHLSPSEKDEVLQQVPQLLNPKVTSWMVTDLPEELDNSVTKTEDMI